MKTYYYDYESRLTMERQDPNWRIEVVKDSDRRVLDVILPRYGIPLQFC